MTAPPIRLGIYGTGRLAGSLAAALVAPRVVAEVAVVGIAGRCPDRVAALAAALGVPALAEGELVSRVGMMLIAVPDSAIEEVAGALARAATAPHERPASRWGVHCAGALGPEALAPLADAGWATATWHPLQAFPTPHTSILPGTTWTITTEDAALGHALERLTDALGGIGHRLAAEHRAAYHAAAVLAANDAAAVLAHAVEVLIGCGFTERAALDALAPLARSALDALTAHGVPAGLTGPVVRGDVATITSHLAALDDRPATQALYRAAGLGLLPFARSRGLSEPLLESMRAALTAPSIVP